MKVSSLLLIACAGAALAACGRMAPLQPARGQSLPQKPLMARTTPDAEELLEAPTYARPRRVDELVRRSQPRERDRFDLPPPEGGSVPLPIVGAEETPSEDTGPVEPE
jgi:hypothetical protein